MVTKPTIGQDAWGTVLNSALDQLETDRIAADSAVQAFAIARANHTGTQMLSTISDAGNAASKNVGTTAGTVAAGDDSRLAGVLTKAQSRIFYLSDYVTPNSPATECGPGWDTAMAALLAAGGGTLFIDGHFYTARALVTTSSRNSQLPLPVVVGTTDQKVRIRIEGYGALSPEAGSVTQASGSIIESTLTGVTYSAGTGLPSIIGGPAKALTTNFGFSNVMAEIDGVIVRAPNNPSLTAVDFGFCAQARVGALLSDINTGGVGYALDITLIAQPTHAHALGYRAPTVGNNAVNQLEMIEVYGYYTGVEMGEHFDARSVLMLGCILGVAVSNYGGHLSKIALLGPEHNTHVLGFLDYSSGVSSTPASLLRCSIDITMSIEDALAGAPAFMLPVSHVNDPSSYLRGSLRLVHSVSGGPAPENIIMLGGVNLQLTDLAGLPMYYDQAARSDSTSTPDPMTCGANWSGNSGTWGISSNRLYSVTSVADAILWRNMPSPDGEVSCTLSTGNGGVVFRAVDAQNFYVYQPAGGLFKVINGLATAVDTTTMAVWQSGERVTVTMKGPVITVCRGAAAPVIRDFVFDGALLTGRGRGIMASADVTTRFWNFATS